jgi:phosphatidylglycerophosphatase A
LLNKYGLVENGEVWMNMIKSRIMSAHTYNEEMAERVVNDVKNVYFDEFVALHTTFEAIQSEEE